MRGGGAVWNMNHLSIFICAQCSHSKFKLGVFIPPHFEIRGYEVKFEGMTF